MHNPFKRNKKPVIIRVVSPDQVKTYLATGDKTALTNPTNLCRHDWHKLFACPTYSVCYNCRAIKDNVKDVIIREYADYKDKLPKRLQT